MILSKSIFSKVFPFLGQNLGLLKLFIIKIYISQIFVSKSVFRSRSRSEPRLYEWNRSRYFLPGAGAEKKIWSQSRGILVNWLINYTEKNSGLGIRIQSGPYNFFRILIHKNLRLSSSLCFERKKFN